MLNPAACLAVVALLCAVEKSPYETGRFIDHDAPVTSVVIAPDGEVVSADGDGIIHRWDAKTLEKRGDKTLGPFKHPTQLAISPKGERLAAAGADEAFFYWVRTNPEQAVFNHLGNEAVLTSVAFSPDGKLLAVAGLDGGTTIWDTSNNLVDGTFRTSFDDKQLDLPANCLLELVTFSPDSKVLIGIARRGPGYTMQMWDPVSGKQFGERAADGPALAIAPNGSSLVTGHIVFKFAKGQQPGRLETYHDLNAAVFAPDSKWVVTGGHDNRLVFWDPQSGKQLAAVRAHDNAITALALSKDGKQLVSGSRDGTARVWDVDKILAEKPFDEPLAKLAKVSKAYDAWRLGYCYTRGVMGYEPQKPKSALLDEAEKLAKTLGVVLPALPESGETSAKAQFLAGNQEQLAKQVVNKLGQTEGRVFLVGLTLPMLKLLLDTPVGASDDFTDKMLPEFAQECVTHLDVLPVMFERISRAGTDEYEYELLGDRFDDLMREIDLTLEAQAKAKK